MTQDGVGKRTPFAGYRLTHRGARGVLTMKKDGKGGGLVGALAVAEGDDVMVITEGGIITRMAVDEIRRTESRTTQGVIVQKVPEGDTIAAIALVPEAEEAEAVADAETSLDEALAAAPDSEGGPFDAPGRGAAGGPGRGGRHGRAAGGRRGGHRRQRGRLGAGARGRPRRHRRGRSRRARRRGLAGRAVARAWR